MSTDNARASREMLWRAEAFDRAANIAETYELAADAASYLKGAAEAYRRLAQTLAINETLASCCSTAQQKLARVEALEDKWRRAAADLVDWANLDWTAAADEIRLALKTSEDIE